MSSDTPLVKDDKQDRSELGRREDFTLLQQTLLEFLQPLTRPLSAINVRDVGTIEVSRRDGADGFDEDRRCTSRRDLSEEGASMKKGVGLNWVNVDEVNMD